MRFFLLAPLLALFVFAQEAPLEPNISHSILVREDVFAGLIGNDMARFERGVKTIERLLVERPKNRPSLLAWKGTTFVVRAIRAKEQGQDRDFQINYRDALLLFADASDEAPNDGSVAAIIGGTYAVMADRLPELYRKGAWAMAYRNYQTLWKLQESDFPKLSVHAKGELLSGLALSAKRSGHLQEVDTYLDRIVAAMPGTPYAKVAGRWKQDPSAAAKIQISCLSCHDEGRLENVRKRAAAKGN